MRPLWKIKGVRIIFLMILDTLIILIICLLSFCLGANYANKIWEDRYEQLGKNPNWDWNKIRIPPETLEQGDKVDSLCTNNQKEVNFPDSCQL